MNSTEWKRLRAYWLANKTQSQHRPSLQGRRAVKGHAGGYGAVLKSSRVISMSVETQHFQRQAKQS